MSDEQDDSQKTEEATEQHLEKAREKGQIPLSREVNHFFMLMGSAIVLVGIGPYIAQHITLNISHFLYFIQYDISQIPSLLSQTIIKVGAHLLMCLSILMLAAFVAGISQTKFLISSQSLQPKLEKISLAKGFKKIFGLKNITEFIKGLLKIIITAAAAYKVIVPEFFKMQLLPTYQLPNMLDELYELIQKLFISVLSIIFFVALVDYMYQKFEHLRRMRMSKHDIKEEQKDSDGDPHVKQKLKSMRQSKTQQRMMSEVPAATVIITNPTHFSVALAYDHASGLAPKVVAKGTDLVAFRIRDLAEEHNVPIVESPVLARSLYAEVEIGKEIPENYYQAVAQVIRYVMGIEKKRTFE